MNNLCFLLKSDWALMHSVSVTDEWPIMTNCGQSQAMRSQQEIGKRLMRDQQETDKIVFFVVDVWEECSFCNFKHFQNSGIALQN